MIMILFKSLGKRTSIGSYYDEKSLTKCYCPVPHRHPHRHPPIYSRRKSLLSRKETTSSAFLFYTKNNTFPFETFLYLIKSTKWN